MKITHTRRRTRLNALALLLCCLMVMANLAKAQVRLPPPGVPSGKGSTSGRVDASVLSKAGPQFASGYLLSNISARVFARAAPMVAEYQLGNESTATITLTVTIKKKQEPFTYKLKPTGSGVQQEVFHLPDRFGQKPLVALLSVKAENVDPTNKRFPDFVLYALALGEKAVGSLKIDSLRFQPSRVRATEKISVTYSFHSLADFDRAAVDFRFVGTTIKGEPACDLVNTQKISGGLRRGETKEGKWDGKDQKGKVSKGRHHLLYVRAWFEAKNGGAWGWVSDTSRQRVIIE